MPVHQGGNPIVWDDTAAPVFGQALGAAAPSDAILATADPADTTMDVHCLTFNENTEDRIYVGIQVLHDLYLPASGNVAFRPHAHFTFVTEPTTGRTVIWKLAYVYAKPGTDVASAGAFAAAPTIIAANTYTTGASAELRKHLIIDFPEVTIPVANCGPSMAIQFTIKLDTTSTIDANCVSLLFADWHYQKGPLGTIGEFS